MGATGWTMMITVPENDIYKPLQAQTVKLALLARVWGLLRRSSPHC
jgi:hypothetical protein